MWKASQNPTFEISRKGPPLVSDYDHALEQRFYNFPQHVPVRIAHGKKLGENRANWTVRSTLTSTIRLHERRVKELW